MSIPTRGLALSAAALAGFGLTTAKADLDLRFYEGIDGAAMQGLLDSADYPDNPTDVVLFNAAPFFFADDVALSETSGFVEFPQNGEAGFPGGDSGLDNYGGAFSGILYPPVTGEYRFHIRSDDNSSFYINTEGAEPLSADDIKSGDLAPVAIETGCCNSYQPFSSSEETSDPIMLEAGAGYYVEFLWKEGGGGDWFQVGWSLDGGPAETIPSFYIQRDVNFGESSADGITSFEGDIEAFVEEGDDFCCIGVAFDKEGAATIQWQVDRGSGFQDLSDNDHVIGSTSSALQFFDVSAEWDGYLYRAIVDGDEGPEVELEVEADDRAPEVNTVDARGNPYGFRIILNEAVNPDSLDLSKITIDGDPLPAGAGVRFDNDNTAIQIDFIDEIIVDGVLPTNPSFVFEVDETYSVGIEDGAFADIAFEPNEVEESSKEFFFGEGVTQVWDFNDGLPEDWSFFGNAEHRETGGVGDSGFLSVTDGAGSQLGAAKLNDTVPAVQSVTFSFQARIGDASGRPADGYSFNVANDIPDGTYPQSEEGYAGGDAVSSFPDGLVISFDNWASGGEDEGVGFQIKYQGESKAFVAAPDIRANAEVTENADGIPTIHRGERWFPVSIDMRADGTATIMYDGITVMDSVQVGWDGVENASIGFGGRTGGAWQSHWFDDVAITLGGTTPGPVVVNEQPEGTTVEERETFALRVNVGGSPFGREVQWYKDGELVEGANSLVYTVDSALPSMSGEYHAVVSNEFSTTTSGTATVVVNPDVVPPELTGLSSSPLLNQVFATFSENVDISGATMTLATEGGDAIEVLGASASGASVSIDTGDLDAGTRYVITFADVADLAETPNTASGMDDFLSNARRSGGLTFLFYELGGGGLGFLADSEPGEYPEGFNAFGPGDSLTNIGARQSGSTTYFEVPASGDINVNPPGNVADNYGAIAFGHLRPQATGDYRFFIAVDDNAQLWLSDSDDPADAEIIANEPGWNGVRQYDDGKEDNWSDPIPLVAGEEYYIELRWSEGGGGDNAAVTWTFTDDGSEPEVPSNGSNPIGAEFLISNLPIFDDITWVASPGNGSAGVLVDSGSFSITLTDGFLTKVDPDSIMATVGGEAISLTVVTDDEGNHTASGSVSGNFPVNAEVPVEVTFSTTDGGSETISYTFQTEDLPVLPAAWATPFDEVGDRGHNVRVVQALDSAGRANNTEAAEAQLQDDNPPSIFEGSGIFDVVNFNQDIDDGSGGNGVFRGASGNPDYQIADINLAEVDLLTDSADTDDENHTNDWAMEVTSYLAFTEAGIYTMGVNSDDGFRVTAGRTVDPADSTLEIGVFSGGRGAANDSFQSTFRTLINEPGVYAFRTIAYEGGGGASMEWYSIDGNVAALINGEGGIASYVSRASDPDEVTEAIITSVSVDDAGNLTIEYTGTLQSATAVTGPYADVAGASSPYTTTPGDLMFFRVQ